MCVACDCRTNVETCCGEVTDGEEGSVVSHTVD